MLLRTILILAIGPYLLCGCSHLPSAGQLVATHPVEVTTESGSYHFDALKPIDVEGSVIRVTGLGRVPLVILSSEYTHTPYEITLPTLAHDTIQEPQVNIHKSINESALEIVMIIDEVNSNKPQEAYQRTTNLIKAHPQLAPAHYIKAQLDLILKNRDEAIGSLKTAINLMPTFQKATDLLAQIQKDPSR